MRIRTLTAGDVPAALRLSSQAGWNQVEADWHRLLALAPETCFAGTVDGEVVATSTLVTYEDIGWIGMVLVEASHRRQGYGMELFREALSAGQARDLAVVGLDATDAGRAVYRKADFVDVAPIERWGGELVVPSIGEDVPTVERDAPAERLRRTDAEVSETDRGALLTRLHAETETQTFLAADESGYAVVRPGRTHSQIGPLVAETPETLRALLRAVADSLGEQSVILDTFPGRADLGQFGLEAQRSLTRMTHGTASRALLGDAIVAAAGFELG